MKDYKTILYSLEGRIARVTLNRPDIHNAFNDTMLSELIDALKKIGKDQNARVVILTGNGKSFCAGADLNWMKKMINYTYEENIEDSNLVSECMYTLYTLPQPTIARVNGSAIGGGMGLVAGCDIAIAQQNAKFSLSEVKLGLVPACISPYVIKRAGESRCRELFLTGKRITAEEALNFGLVNRVVPLEKLNEAVDEVVRLLLTSGPNAIATCKELLQKVPGLTLDEAKTYTAQVIASLRISDEGQEGMNAFLQKRKPKWHEDSR